MKDKKPFGDTELGDSLGIAAIILAVCLGVGGCIHLVSIPTAPDTQTSQPAADSSPASDSR